MALPNDPPLTATMIRDELGLTDAQPLVLSNSDVRSLAGVTGDTIKWSDFYGKSVSIPFTFQGVWNPVQFNATTYQGAFVHFDYPSGTILSPAFDTDTGRLTFTVAGNQTLSVTEDSFHVMFIGGHRYQLPVLLNEYNNFGPKRVFYTDPVSTFPTPVEGAYVSIFMLGAKDTTFMGGSTGNALKEHMTLPMRYVMDIGYSYDAGSSHEIHGYHYDASGVKVGDITPTLLKVLHVNGLTYDTHIASLGKSDSPYSSFPPERIHVVKDINPFDDDPISSQITQQVLQLTDTSNTSNWMSIATDYVINSTSSQGLNYFEPSSDFSWFFGSTGGQIYVDLWNRRFP